MRKSKLKNKYKETTKYRQKYSRKPRLKTNGDVSSAGRKSQRRSICGRRQVISWRNRKKHGQEPGQIGKKYKGCFEQ